MGGMKFYCLCMSPAVDATVELPSAPRGAGEIFKDVAERENVGGKGLNVARWLAIRGATVACGGLLGEDNARPFEKELAAQGVADRFLRVPGATRRNEMLVWLGGSVKLNRAAFPGLRQAPAPADVLADVDAETVCVFSGSLPSVCGADYYARCVAEAKRRGAVVVLDASGEPLRRAVFPESPAAAVPDVIKPNADECEPLVGFIPHTPDTFRAATAQLNARVPCAIISDGGAGCWFNGTFVAAPSVSVLDTTAAGDTLLAEWVWRTFGGASRASFADGEAARWAVAAGSAAVTMPGSTPPPPDLVARLSLEVAL